MNRTKNKYYNTFFNPTRMTLVGVGLDLNNLDSVTNNVLSNIYRGVAPISPGQTSLEKLAAQSVNAVKVFDFSQTINILKTVGIILSLIFGALLVWIVIKSRNRISGQIAELKSEINPSKAGESKYDAKWKEIREHLESLRDAEWKFAVIEADNILEEILGQMGFRGDSLGEKMKQIDRNQLASIDDLWEAHKLRNIIVHDPDYQVRYNDARVAVGQYEKALREMGVLG